MAGPNIDFWQQRFDAGQLPWDRGEPNPQLVKWLADGILPVGRIAVPGCGSGHEVEVLARAGFTVTALDYAPGAVERVRARMCHTGLAATVLLQDVLEWQPPAALDAVYEQTCLCALHPDRWTAYARQLHGWLRPDGQLALLAMQALRAQAADGFVEGPPYHVDIHALRALFPLTDWVWPRPPYARVPHPSAGQYELAVLLQRR